jgi:hypothetical protein
LKQFENGNKGLFLNEKDAFLALRGQEGIVRCLAEYIHREIRRPPDSPQSPHLPDQAADEEVRTTYNILLEYGEFDLDEYFAEFLPPVLQTELEKFWSALFEVADAVEGIHNLAIRIAEEVRLFYGYVPQPHVSMCLKIPLTHHAILGGMPTSSRTIF